MPALPTRSRRAQRLAASCPAEVRFGAGRWTGHTQDLGEGGCRIVARLALRPGESVSLKIRYAGVPQALEVVGTVAWTTPRPPWQTGVAFARGQEADAKRFVRAVLAASPGLAPENGRFPLAPNSRQDVPVWPLAVLPGSPRRRPGS